MVQYRLVVDEKVLQLAFEVSQENRRLLITALDQLQANWRLPSDYRERDSEGRTNEVKLFGNFLITYWIDDAVREIRVKEIVEV